MLALYRHFIDNVRDHMRIHYKQIARVRVCDSLEKYMTILKH